jgi:lantibiotic biosynthesis dehydratase-like protein
MNSSDSETGRPGVTAGLFVLRVAGLPVSCVHRLRCPESADWADEVLLREDRLGARGAELSELLHGLIKANEDDDARRRLLSLRRQIFRNALPPAPAAAVTLVSAMDGAVAAVLEAWLADRERLAELAATGARLVAAELARSRAELWTLAAEAPLLRGLPLASPTLARQLGLPGGGAVTTPDKRARRTERSILAYLYRTACKTSPFSTFTGVGLGLAGDGSDHGAQSTVPEPWSGHVRLNVVALGRLAEVIMADPQRRGDLPVDLAPGWRHDDDRVRYVRRSVTAGDNSAAVSFDAVRDQLFFLRRSGILDRLIALFTERPGLHCRDVVRWLATQESAEPQESERYLSTLLELGMLQVSCLHIDVHVADPLAAMREALLGLDRPWADELAARLRDPAALVAQYPTADAPTRRRLLAELRTQLQELMRDLGSEDAPLPLTLLYEDVRVGDEPLEIDVGAGLRLVAPALRAVEQILPAFDHTLPHRVIFKGFFLARFGAGGRCDDVLKLVADFHEDFYDQYRSYTAARRPFDEHGEYVPEENWMALPGITAIDEARRHFVGHMRKLWAERHDSAEVDIGERIVEETARLLPPSGRPSVAQSHFLQFVARDVDPLVVLNQSYGGMSFVFSRFTHCFDAPSGFSPGTPTGLSDRLRDDARALQASGSVFAEITGGAASTNLNLHAPLTDYEIVCPGETSCAPADRQIALDDLYVVHDAEEDRLELRSRRLGREVVPCYFGYLMQAALPEIPRTLMLLAPTSMGAFDVWGGVPDERPDRGVTSRPRVRYGSLVLSRRSWSTLASTLPTRSPGAGDDEWFLGWRRWTRAHAVPRQVFVTVHQSGVGAAGPAKPQYLDFDSYLSVAAFESLLKSGADRVVLREMLPSEDQLHVRSARGEHVAEVAVQTDRRHR